MTTIDYGYDGLSRLLTANYSVGADYTYGYDVAGNLVNNNGTTPTYNAANQMVHDGTNTLTYDANGNLTHDGVDSLTWDRANRMLTAPGSTSYKYDGLGNRIQQTILGTPNVVTDYLNDVQPGLVKLLRQTVDGTNVDHFVHAVRGIHSMDDGTDWQYAVQDGLRSVRGWADVNSNVTNPVSYSPYGVPSTNVDGFAYTGEMRDASGLQYHRARYYSPNSAIWTARDKFAGLNCTPMSLNRYTYTHGNPVNNTDPSGYCISSPERIGAACAVMLGNPLDDAIGIGVPLEILTCIAAIGCLTIAGAIAVYNLLMAGRDNDTATGEEVGQQTITGREAGLQGENDIEAVVGGDPGTGPAGQPNTGTEIPPILPTIEFPTPTPTQPPCATNYPPGSYDSRHGFQDMNDIMCNVNRYSSLVGPQPANWWFNQGLNSSRLVMPQIATTNWANINGGAYYGRISNPNRRDRFRDAGSRVGRVVEARLGYLFINQPGIHPQGTTTRADIMTMAVHELRHAGQHADLFTNETILGQPVSCSTLTPRQAEIDAHYTTNVWQSLAVQVGLLNVGDFRLPEARITLNGGVTWTEMDAANEVNSNQSYTSRQGFDVAPAFDCQRAVISNTGCIEPLVLLHI